MAGSNHRSHHVARTAVLLLVIVFGGGPTALGAEKAAIARRVARVVVIQPREGHEQGFEAGYMKHLEWHRAQKDSWTWFGWTFVLGDRLGQFMDGTFGHDSADFDGAVDPAGDAADNAQNVVPHAVFARHAVYEHLDALSSARNLPDASPLLIMTTYRVRAGGDARFEARLAAEYAAGSREKNGPYRYAWLKLVLGGRDSEYVLLRPASNWRAALALGNFFAALEGGGFFDEIEEVRTEMLRYRANMSYVHE